MPSNIIAGSMVHYITLPGSTVNISACNFIKDDYSNSLKTSNITSSSLGSTVVSS